MNSTTYRWPIVFAFVALTAGLFAFFIPSLVASSILGGIAVVFFVLAMLSAPTAIRADASEESRREAMETTLGASK